MKMKKKKRGKNEFKKPKYIKNYLKLKRNFFYIIYVVPSYYSNNS